MGKKANEGFPEERENITSPPSPPLTPTADPITPSEQGLKGLFDGLIDGQSARSLIGEVIEGKYRILEQLGQGGMGVVYKALHLAIGKLVAVKVLLSREPKQLERFRREVRSACGIGHHNIIEVNDFGVLEDERFFCVMEYLDGKSLASIITEEAPLDVGRTLRLMEQICSALEAAHGKGIIHRDIKADNIFVVRRGEEEIVKILDFGLALDLQGSERLTATGNVVGTLPYLSPEQVEQGRVDGRTDIYSLGLVLYEMVTGRRLQQGDGLLRALTGTPWDGSPGQTAPGSPAAQVFNDVILRATAKDPEQRYASMKDLFDALREAPGSQEPSREASLICPQCRTEYPADGEDGEVPALQICSQDGRFLVDKESYLRAADDPLLGQLIGGNYVILSVLGGGSMGCVYRGRQLSVAGRPVAIKVLRYDPLQSRELVERFRREMEITARLRHPHIITIYDYGEEGTNLFYIVMEMLEGLTLEAEMRRGSFPWSRTVRILGQVSSALAEAHSLNVVHRDLKPANMMLTRVDGEDFIKILDFGIGKIIHAHEEAKTDVIGTPLYMAPEQIRGEGLGPHTDIYALGIILYELLAQRPPFGGVVAQLLSQHLFVAPPALSTLLPSRLIPRALERVAVRALDKDPAKRQSSALEFKRQLEEALVQDEASREASPVLSPSKPLWRSRGILGGALLGLCGIIAAVVVISMGREPDEAGPGIRRTVSAIAPPVRDIPAPRGDAGLSPADVDAPRDLSQDRPVVPPRPKPKRPHRRPKGTPQREATPKFPTVKDKAPPRFKVVE